MLEGLKALFGDISHVTEVEREVKDLRRERERLEKNLEERDDRIKSMNRRREDEVFDEQRAQTRSRVRHEDQIEDLETRLQKAEYRADEAQALALRTREAELLYEDAMSDLERATERFTQEKKAIAIEQLTIAKAEMQASFDELNDDMMNATARAEAAEASAKEKDTVIRSLQEQLKNHGEFVKFAMDKVPGVNLDKFNITVDVPPAEVTVVSGGNQGGGKKK